MERAELPEKSVDTESQPHQHACEESFPSFVPKSLLPSTLEGEGMEKLEFNTDFLAILVLFPSIFLARGKS